MAQKPNNNRQELDINFPTVLTGALLLTIIIYLLFLPFKESYVGILLYQRGFTQYLTVFFASLVVIITINKYLKIKREDKILKKIGLPEKISFDNYK